MDMHRVALEEDVGESFSSLQVGSNLGKSDGQNLDTNHERTFIHIAMIMSTPTPRILHFLAIVGLQSACPLGYGKNESSIVQASST